MKNNLVVLTVVLGTAAAVLGLLALLVDTSALGLVAGACGGAAALGLLRSRPTADGGDSAALETVVADQIQARLAVEAKLAIAEEKLQATEDRREVARTAPQTGDSLYDTETNLFSEAYFGPSVMMRIAAARRHLRPVSIAFLDVVEGGRSDNPTSTDPTMVADTLRATLREADTSCRMNDGRFAIMLEDTPESGAVWTIERIRRAIADQDDELIVWAGLACYPAHAFDADEVLKRASDALASARDWHQDRIEVASVD